MQIIISTSGEVSCIYTESIELKNIGRLTIRRGSHVEPDAVGKWIVNMSPINGPQLGPFDVRSKAISAEILWLEHNWLLSQT